MIVKDSVALTGNKRLLDWRTACYRLINVRVGGIVANEFAMEARRNAGLCFAVWGHEHC